MKLGEKSMSLAHATSITSTNYDLFQKSRASMHLDVSGLNTWLIKKRAKFNSDKFLNTQ